MQFDSLKSISQSYYTKRRQSTEILSHRSQLHHTTSSWAKKLFAQVIKSKSPSEARRRRMWSREFWCKHVPAKLQLACSMSLQAAATFKSWAAETEEMWVDIWIFVPWLIVITIPFLFMSLQNAVTHKKIDQDINEVKFNWTAPKQLSEKVTFLATIAQNGGVFWVKVPSAVVAVSK